MTPDHESLKAHVKGAPTLESLKEINDGLKGLFEAISGVTAKTIVTLRCDAKDCNTTTPFDIAAGEQAIWEVANQGWTRSPEIPAHHCPTCSKRKAAK